MRVSIDVQMHYSFTEPNTVALVLEAARTEGQTVLSESMDLGDAELHRIEGDCGVGQRIWARIPGQEMRLSYRSEVEITRPAPALDGLEALPLHLIPSEPAPYIRPSRYCQSDKFVAFVADLDEMGSRLQQLDKAYASARNKLVEGRGNLVGRVENLKLLGARASKSLPGELLERSADLPALDELGE